MALSMLQDAQTRGLAAAIANMKHEEDMRMSVSPPIMADPTQQFYARLLSQNLLHPQLMAANTALMAQLPMHMHQLAAAAAATGSPFYPHPHQHPATMFGQWPVNQPRTSPPISPISPLMATHLNNNNMVSTTTNHLPTSAKKSRKPKQTSAMKKELMTPPPASMNIDIQMSHDMTSPTGPISPPTSGASPQSTGSMDGHHMTSTGKDSSRDKQFTCKICSRSFGYKHVLQNHERTHTGEKPFECPECHKRFTRDHHLKTHMRLHTGEKPYHCDHCDRHFVQVANLRRHMRVHTGEKPYKCEICKSTFADSNQLKGHKAVHNDEKPFQCEHCNEKFKRRHHFVAHKCAGLTSTPVTTLSPALSPTMSLSDQKSGSSHSDISELSMDLSRSSLHQHHHLQQTLNQHHFGAHHQQSTAMDLCADSTPHSSARKSHDVRRIMRAQPLLAPSAGEHASPCIEPEQTEPEDLSMHSPRSNLSADDDLDDLEDAATLYAKQKEQLRQQHLMMNHSMSPM